MSKSNLASFVEFSVWQVDDTFFRAPTGTDVSSALDPYELMLIFGKSTPTWTHFTLFEWHLSVVLLIAFICVWGRYSSFIQSIGNIQQTFFQYGNIDNLLLSLERVE